MNLKEVITPEYFAFQNLPQRIIHPAESLFKPPYSDEQCGSVMTKINETEISLTVEANLIECTNEEYFDYIKLVIPLQYQKYTQLLKKAFTSKPAIKYITDPTNNIMYKIQYVYKFLILNDDGCALPALFESINTFNLNGTILRNLENPHETSDNRERIFIDEKHQSIEFYSILKNRKITFPNLSEQKISENTIFEVKENQFVIFKG